MNLEVAAARCRRPILLGVVGLLAAGLIFTVESTHAADDPTAPTTGEDSPFDDFPSLQGYDRDEPRLDAGEVPRIQDTDTDATPPDEPVQLRVAVDEHVRYEIANRLGINIAQGFDFQTDYRSGLVVDYRPVSELRRDRLPRWNIDLDAHPPEVREGQPIVATVSDYSAAFEHPLQLRDAARPHRLLQDATFSFRLDDRGQIGDIRIHPPTNPLVRGSIEDVIRLLANTQPALSDEPVAPGDTWSDSIDMTVEDDENEHQYRLETEYHFARWTPCSSAVCAQIVVERSIDTSGLRQSRHLHTRTDADATGGGSFLLRIDDGRIVSSHWTYDARGDTVATRSQSGDTMHEFDFQLDIETTVRAAAIE